MLVSDKVDATLLPSEIIPTEIVFSSLSFSKVSLLSFILSFLVATSHANGSILGGIT